MSENGEKPTFLLAALRVRRLLQVQQQTYLKCANGFSNLENSGLTPPNTHTHTLSLSLSHTHTHKRSLTHAKKISVKYQKTGGNPSLASAWTQAADANPAARKNFAPARRAYSA